MKKQYLYLCNKKQCSNCSYPNCKHTSKRVYALHPDSDTEKDFELKNIDNETEIYFEKEKN